MTHYITAERLTIARVEEIMTKGYKIALSDDAIQRINHCREYLDKKMEDVAHPIYGVTTGFGSLCNISISKEHLSQLQKNLMMSHACGTGQRVPAEIARLMLLLKVQSLSYGHSGVQLITVERLVDMFNNNIIPVVYEQGSLGASTCAHVPATSWSWRGRGRQRNHKRRAAYAENGLGADYPVL